MLRGRTLSTPRSTKGRNKESHKKTDQTSTERTGGEPFTSESVLVCVSACVCACLAHPCLPSPSSSLSANNLPGGASMLPQTFSSSSLQSFLLLRGESPLGHSLQLGGISITETDPALHPLRCLLLSSLLPVATHTQPYRHNIMLLFLLPAFLLCSHSLSSASLCLARNSAAKKGTESSSASLSPTHTHNHTHTLIVLMDRICICSEEIPQEELNSNWAY